MKLTWRKWTRAPKSQRSGFALVLTLIILALAAVTVVAFLTTVTTERASTASYARIEKADFFAEAGVDAAIARVTTEMQYRPYHAIGYRSLSVGTAAKPLTEVIPVIVGPRTTDPAAATYNSAPVATSDVFLLSTTPASTAGEPPGSLPPSNLDDTNSVDLNANHLSTEPKGWIGSPVTATTPIQYRAPWIDVLKDPSKAPQPDSNAANYNPVIGRYAYWIEDETSKLDASMVGNKDSGGGFKRGDGVNLPANSPPKLAVNDLDIGALPLVGALPLPVGDTATNTAIIDFRSGLPMSDARFLNRVTGLATDVHETTKFYETSFGLSDDLAGTGRRRANINGLVTNSTSAATIAANIDDIAYVITGTHLMPTPTISTGTLGPMAAPGERAFEGAPTYTNTLTNFGARFFTSPAPNADQKNMYVERIAANIRDYADTDSFPTYINTSDQVVSGTKPSLAWKSGTEPRAVGKEAIPYMQEIAWYGFQRSMQAAPAPAKSASYDVDIDFYFEFLNPTTKDFVAPTGAFLKVYSRVQWSAGTFPWLHPPDFEYPIPAGTTFPAGAATVLTTVPNQTLDPPGLILNQSAVVRLTGGQRNFTGQTDELINGKPGLQFQGRAGSSTKTTDYTTEAVWGAPTGIYEALGYVASGGGTQTWNMDGNPAEINNKTRFVYSYDMRGNLDVNGNPDQPSRTGDARSLSEQLSMIGGLAALGTDQTRFYGDIAGTGVIPQKTTLGKAKIFYVDPTKWPDYAPAFADSAPTGYAIIRDDAMQSIGELGHIYDPVRTIAVNAGGPVPSILQARGGGRTLKIGQIDDLITGGRFSTTWFNSSWRLADLFSADLTKDSSGNYLKVSNPTSRGKININGVLRDSIDSSGNIVPGGGLAFRAALRSFNFLASPNSDSQLSGKTMSDPEIDSLVSSIQTYLTTNGPMMERGEISQLPFFNSGTAGGKSLASVNDRGREEIFRRCVEMITTRSASFTVYTLGQAIRQDKSGVKTPTGEKRLAITFQLEPRKGSTALEKSSVPYDVVDSYAVKRIYAPQ
jgi:hypothetical protein